jgi:Toluene-4-monooxygenase system protein B (TmoB)
VAAPDQPLIPLYGFLEGDTLGLVILARLDDRIADLAAAVQRSAGVRVPPRAGAELFHRGVRLDGALTVKAAELAPLERIDVRFGAAPDDEGQGPGGGAG